MSSENRDRQAARRPRFHTDGALVVGEPITLSREASRHLLSVLRAVPGEALSLFDGDGRDYTAVLVEAGREARVQVTASVENRAESPLRTTLVQGVSRGDRMDATVRQAVELGVSRIVPVRSRRGAIRLDDARAAKRHAHWRSIIVSACEQCGRARLPTLEPLRSFEEWLADFDAGLATGFVSVPGASTALADAPLAPGTEAAVVIGPEGGLERRERDAAFDAGLRPVHLGPRVLRTETAGPAALTLLQARHGDLRS